jgi:flagellar export protein FliJ
MPFRFPLAAVLLVRENAEKREERALQRIQLEIAHATRQVEELNAEIAYAYEAREEALQHLIPAFQLHDYLRRSQAVEEKKKTLLLRLQFLGHELERQMKVYQAAHRDREALTNMLEEQREAYEQEQTRNRQKQLDDLFMARRHRN